MQDPCASLHVLLVPARHAKPHPYTLAVAYGASDARPCHENSACSVRPRRYLNSRRTANNLDCVWSAAAAARKQKSHSVDSRAPPACLQYVVAYRCLHRHPATAADCDETSYSAPASGGSKTDAAVKIAMRFAQIGRAH